MTGYTVGMSRGLGIGACVAIVAIAGATRAQEAPEPLAVAYEAPEGCPTSEAFFREISARTTRARAAQPNERARVRDARRRAPERRAIRGAALDRGRQCIEHRAVRVRQDVQRDRLCAGALAIPKGTVASRLRRAREEFEVQVARIKMRRGGAA